jgi:Predicted nucleotidyltransferases
MKTREEILELLNASLPKLRECGVREIGLFGSVVRNEQQAKSDVDILVDLEPHTFDSYMDLLFYLEERLGCKIDLVMKDSLKTSIRDSVISETVYV